MFYNYYNHNEQENVNKTIAAAKEFARTLTQEQLKEKVENLRYERNFTYHLYFLAYNEVYNERA